MAVSAIDSAIISDAPARASAAVLTPFSSSIYLTASGSNSTGLALVLFKERINSASGSKPFSLAIVALVRRLGLYGRYRSSNSVFNKQLSILARNSGVSLS